MSSMPPPAYPMPPAEDPGKTLGIVALVLAFFVQLLGLILGIVALNQSKKAGYSNGPAKAAIILSIVFMVLGLIILGIVLAFVLPNVAVLAEICNQTGPGRWMLEDGTIVTC